jgi:DNA repair protein RadD
VRVRAGDYVPGDLEIAANTARITGDAVEQYRLRADRLPAIAFCVSVAHAKQVAAAFVAAGCRAVAVYGGMPVADRVAAIAGLATGAIEVVTSCETDSRQLSLDLEEKPAAVAAGEAVLNTDRN